MSESGGDLNSILNKSRCKKGTPCTHTSMGNPKGAFSITNKDAANAFMKAYTDAVFRKNMETCIIERHIDICPIIYDFDLRYSASTPERRYTSATIYSIVEVIYELIERYFEITDNAILTCVILEKPAARFANSPSDNGEPVLIKDGFHLQFPYIVTCPDIQYLIREELLEELENRELLDSLQCSNSLDDIVDKAIIEKNGWTMYGSTKPGQKPYAVTDVVTFFDKRVKQINNMEKFLNPFTLVNLLSIRNCTFGDMVSIKISAKTLLTKWKEKNKRKEIESIKKSTINNNSSPTFNEDDIKTARKLLLILDPKRAESYDSWFRVGCCLRNIDYRMLPDFIEFSLQAEAYKETAENDCRELWCKLKKGLGIGTLFRWAQEDNPTEYNNIRRTTIEHLLCKSVPRNGDKKKLDANHYILKALYEKYKHNFVCVSFSSKIWYMFDGIMWTRSDDAPRLRELIKTELHDDFLHLSMKYSVLANSETNPDCPNKDHYQKLSAKFGEYSQLVRNHDFKKKIMDEATEHFFWNPKEKDERSDFRFEQMLDKNLLILGMKNGIYDLVSHQFREAHCEDYISISTNINYKEHSWEDENVQDIMLFISQIIPKKGVRDYVLTLLSSLLDGNLLELFNIWTGSGGNGKSKLIELVELTLGDYCAKLSVSAITCKRAQSNSATPEIARLKGRRFVCLQEPSENEVLNTGYIKELTGGDKMQARSLHQEPFEFKPQAEFIMMCNNMPRVPSVDDGGIWRRIRVVAFESRFVDDPDPEKPNEFKRDYNLNKKFANWGEPFFWILTQYYKIFKFGDKTQGILPGLHEPPEVLLATQEYKNNNDFYADFIDNNIEYNKGSLLILERAEAEFQAWFKENFNDKCPDKRALKKYFEGKYGEYIDPETNVRGWKNHRLISMRDEEREYL